MILLAGFYQPGQAQEKDETIILLIKLDSISHTTSVSRHFAAIYFETTVNAMNFFSKADEKIQALMNRLQIQFGNYFFRSAIAHQNGTTIPPEWKAYYSDSTAPALRYVLYGINAHVNGDIWQAITTGFSPEEIRMLKPYYFLYQKGLIRIYREVYKKSMSSHWKLRLLHNMSMGLDKLYGKLLLRRWRKRQMALAELYYTDPALHAIKLHKLHLKMARLNVFIHKNI